MLKERTACMGTCRGEFRDQSWRPRALHISAHLADLGLNPDRRQGATLPSAPPAVFPVWDTVKQLPRAPSLVLNCAVAYTFPLEEVRSTGHRSGRRRRSHTSAVSVKETALARCCRPSIILRHFTLV
jgi:hypothetical protein